MNNIFIFDKDDHTKICGIADLKSIPEILEIPYGVKTIDFVCVMPFEPIFIEELIIPETVEYISENSFSHFYIMKITNKSKVDIDACPSLIEHTEHPYLYFLEDKLFYFYGSTETNKYYNIDSPINYPEVFFNVPIEKIFVFRDFTISGELSFLKDLKYVVIDIMDLTIVPDGLVFSDFNILNSFTTPFKRRYKEIVFDENQYDLLHPYTEVVKKYDYKIIIDAELLKKNENAGFVEIHKDYIIPYDYNVIKNTFPPEDADIVNFFFSLNRTKEQLIALNMPESEAAELYSEECNLS